MRNFFLVFLFCLGFSSLFAQNEYDALRYSGGDILGSARAQAVGGAFSAVGADMSAATMNPAGTALYQYSDFAMTARYSIVNNNANYLGKTQNGNITSFNLPSLGYIFHVNKNQEDDDQKLKGFSLGMGYNQLDNFKRDIQASGYNPHSSITDFFVEKANGTQSSVLEGYPGASYQAAAFYTYAIDTLKGSSTQYFPAFNRGRIDQSANMTQSGNRGEWFFNMAFNRSNKLYVGATMGLQSLTYDQRLYIKEKDVNNLHTAYQNNPNNPLEFPGESLKFADGFKTTGSGFNLQVGAIYRPVNAFRFGLSVKSPTYYSLTDNYTFSIDNTQQRATTQNIVQASDSFASQWKLRTPLQATFGAMVLFGKRGFLSADIDFKDYSGAKLSSRYASSSPNYYSYTGENSNISKYFTQVINYRFGGELRLGNFRLRAGTTIMGNGLKSDINQYQNPENPAELIAFKPSRRMITGGVGYRSQSFFVDFALVNQQIKDIYRPYVLTKAGSFTPTVLNTTTINSIVITAGASF